MNALAIPDRSEIPRQELTANDRFHRSWRAMVATALILATAIHFAVLNLWPDLMVADVSYSGQELIALELPPEIEIPEAPAAVARPATPVIAAGEIDEEITIAPTTFEQNPVSELPPPPSLEDLGRNRELAEAPVFTPFTVKPDVKNRDEVREALKREYPSFLRDVGLGGTVLVWFFIDEEGRVQRTLVHESSGHDALDEAALKVADIIEFTPALNRDRRVPVWISLPISFKTR